MALKAAEIDGSDRASGENASLEGATMMAMRGGILTTTLCESVVHGRMDENVMLLLELFQHTQVESDVRRGESPELRERRSASNDLFFFNCVVMNIHCGVKYFKF